MKITYDKLWQLLKQKHITKNELCEKTNISTRTISKLTHGENVTTDILLKICEFMNCKIGDIMELNENPRNPNNVEELCLSSEVGLRLGTVFSGIGAIEHALDRMHFKHTIIFACDNGDVDILSKEIDNDIDKICSEFEELQGIIQDINVISEDDFQHKQALTEELKSNREKYEESRLNLDIKSIDILCLNILNLLETIGKDEQVKKMRRQEYLSYASIIRKTTDDSQKLHVLKATLNVINDFSKDNPVSILYEEENLTKKLMSRDNIEWEKYLALLSECYSIFEASESKKVIKSMNDIAERLSMLHERITTFHITKKISEISSYQEQKKYIDSLYDPHKKQNKVRESYLANYPLSEEDYHWNVSFLDGLHYKDKIDLFVGGSPCQSFSLVGKQRGLEDTRGTLFYDYARLVQEIRPKIFIYENVKAVLSNNGGKTWETMKKVFTDLHYNWKYQILNSKDYGIPQNRERLFVVGFRDDLKLSVPFEFPTPIPLTKTMQDFLLDNAAGQYYLPTKGVDFVTNEKNLTKRFTQIDGDVQLCQKKNQQFNWHGDFVFVDEKKAKESLIQNLEKYFLSEKVRKYVLASGTKGFYSRPQVDLEIARPLLTTMHKMHRAGVDNYVTTDGRLRKLTPRECLRLMGFCDSFKIVVSDTSMYQQSGNAIVVDVLIAILSKIRESYPQIFMKEN